MRVSWKLTLCAALVAGCDVTTSPEERRGHGPEFDHGNVPTWYRMWADGAVTVNDGQGRWLSTGATSVTAYPSFYMGTANPDSVSLTFSVPVTDLGGVVETVTAGSYCPTIPFTYAAYGTDGTLLNSGSFSAFCGHNWGFNVHTLEKIKRLVIYAAQPLPSDYGGGHAVWFTIGFNVPCPPISDPVLADADVRSDLLRELTSSRGNGGALAKTEYTGWIYQWEGTNDYFVHPEQDLGATDCSSTIRPPQGVAGAIPVRPYHTHPSYDGETFFGCKYGPGIVSRDPKYGGGSEGDWKAIANQDGDMSLYVVGYTFVGQPAHVYRLDKNIAGSPKSWGTNPNQWQFTPDKCLI